MNNKEIKNKSVALATIVLMLGNSSCVFADNNISKDETVYSKINSNGDRTKTIVTDHLSGEEELVNDFNAYCGEMEGGAIAHVCTLNKVPFVIIRAMSDKADGSADVTYDEFVKVAAHNSKDIVLNMLKAL